MQTNRSKQNTRKALCSQKSKRIAHCAMSSTVEKVTEGVANLTTPSNPPPASLPVTNPGPCFWQSEPSELAELRTTEALPSHSDILIIGGGYAGISTAYHLIKSPSYAGQSITLLEARGICQGATGRNGGHIRPDLYGHIPTYIDRAGVEAGVEIAEFEIAHVQAIKKLVEEEGIECDFALCRTIDVWCNEEAAAKAKATFDKMTARSLSYLNDVIFYTGKEVEGVSRYSCLSGVGGFATHLGDFDWNFNVSRASSAPRPLLSMSGVLSDIETGGRRVVRLPSRTTI